MLPYTYAADSGLFKRLLSEEGIKSLDSDTLNRYVTSVIGYLRETGAITKDMRDVDTLRTAIANILVYAYMTYAYSLAETKENLSFNLVPRNCEHTDKIKRALLVLGIRKRMFSNRTEVFAFLYKEAESLSRELAMASSDYDAYVDRLFDEVFAKSFAWVRQLRKILCILAALFPSDNDAWAPELQTQQSSF